MRPVCGLMPGLCRTASPPSSIRVATERVRTPASGQIPSKQGISMHSGGLQRRGCSLLRRTSRTVGVWGWTALTRSSLHGVHVWSRPVMGCDAQRPCRVRGLAGPGGHRRGGCPADRKEGGAAESAQSLPADSAVGLDGAASLGGINQRGFCRGAPGAGQRRPAGAEGWESMMSSLTPARDLAARTRAQLGPGGDQGK
jgi:hypothetical protein